MSSSNVDDMIAADPVVMFSKSYCPYCHRAKAVLKKKGVSFKAYELDQMSGGGTIQSTLVSKTGLTTVPNIFIG